MSATNAQPVQAANDPLQSVATAMASASVAVRDGASDAMARAKQAVPVAGQYVSRFVYSGFYYVSYGVTFPTLLVANLIPGGCHIAHGLVDGARAANGVVAEMKEKAAARKAAKLEPQVAPVSV